jgi:arylsulfatase
MAVSPADGRCTSMSDDARCTPTTTPTRRPSASSATDRCRSAHRRIELSLDYDKPMTGGPGHRGAQGRRPGNAVRTRIERTVPFLFSIHETLDVGIDLGGPVTSAYAETPFDGTIGDVVIEIR